MCNMNENNLLLFMAQQWNPMAVVVTLMAATESDQPSGSREFTTASLTLFTLGFFMCFEMSSQIACQSESLLAHFTFMRTIACNVKK